MLLTGLLALLFQIPESRLSQPQSVSLAGKNHCLDQVVYRKIVSMANNTMQQLSKLFPTHLKMFGLNRTIAKDWPQS